MHKMTLSNFDGRCYGIQSFGFWQSRQMIVGGCKAFNQIANLKSRIDEDSQTILKCFRNTKALQIYF